jgi:hypothetical protein
MAKVIRGAKKARRRVRGTQISVRVHKAFLTALDQWRKQQQDQPSRPNAMRQLAEISLAKIGPRPKVRRRPGPAANDMAARVIDALADRSAPPENLAKRKRRLLKGPEEFRNIREDQPKSRRPNETSC